MATLLVEVGTEEIPSSFVEGALRALPSLVRETLSTARLEHGQILTWGTPRRLAFAVHDLAERQPDRSEEVTGPPAKVALDPDGEPTKAGLGFAKKMGVPASELRTVETPKGPYVAVTRREKGRTASEVLAEVLPDIWSRVPFPKSMRWGVRRGPFARPVHWLLSRLDGEILPFAFAGVSAGGCTRGHRFLAPEEISVLDPDAYVSNLAGAHVIADPNERRRAVRDALEAAARERGALLVPDEALVDEVTFLVEEPHAVCGGFDRSHLDLPREVLLSAMRGHQRCFALQDEAGALCNAFLAVANTCRDEDRVRRGNERVIQARLADARFFFDQDRKIRLEDRLAALDGMTFQARLGSMADRVRRTADLASKLAARFTPSERDVVVRAAELAKSDLATSMVGEFPDLQGVVGAAYAIAQGEPAAVGEAIREQYLPRGAGDSLPSTPAGAILSLADRLVVLAGGFAAGLQPSGAADPFGLRRSCIGAIRILWDREWSVSLAETLPMARWQPKKGKVRPEAETDAALVEFFAGRVRSLLEDSAPTAMMEACLAASADDVLDVRRRVLALAELKTDPAWTKLAVAFRRAWNITKDVVPGEVDERLMDADAERSLLRAVVRVEPEFAAHVVACRYGEALAGFGAALGAPIDRFFDEVFVMVEDEAVRTNRLRLLRRVVDMVRGVAHLHLLGGAAEERLSESGGVVDGAKAEVER